MEAHALQLPQGLTPTQSGGVDPSTSLPMGLPEELNNGSPWLSSWMLEPAYDSPLLQSFNHPELEPYAA